MERITMTTKELLKGIKEESIVRGAYQRTPSHTPTQARPIIESMLASKYCGTITLYERMDGIKAIIDGSSRLKDCENSPTFEFDKVKLSPAQLDKISSFMWDVVVLNEEDVTSEEKAFVALNSSVALSGIQKNKGTQSDNFNELVDILRNSDICKNPKNLSARQIQKDELVSIASQFVANVSDVWTATNSKLMDAIRGKDVDLERVKKALYTIRNCDTASKYGIISMLTVLYNNADDYSSDTDFGNELSFNIETSGANSAPRNEQRIKDTVVKFRKALKLRKAQIQAQAQTAINPEDMIKAMQV